MSTEVDLSEFEALNPRGTSGRCKVALAVESLEGEDRGKFDAAAKADSGRISNAAIMRWLEGRGLEVASAALTVHRKGTCACARR